MPNFTSIQTTENIFQILRGTDRYINSRPPRQLSQLIKNTRTEYTGTICEPLTNGTILRNKFQVLSISVSVRFLYDSSISSSPHPYVHLVSVHYSLREFTELVFRKSRTENKERIPELLRKHQ
jgi:hypothetical protein